MSARKIPGKFHTAPVTLPTDLQASLAQHVYKQNMTELNRDAEKLQNLLWKRQMPWADWMIRAKAREIGSKLHNKLAKKHLEGFGSSEEEKLTFEQNLKQLVIKRLRGLVYHWKPSSYTSEYDCLVYAKARMAPELAVLTRIFSELKARDSQFKPEFVLDFGSGVASTYWAANTLWPTLMREYMAVDRSRHMNDLALSLIKGVQKQKDTESNRVGLFFRQFLATKNDRKFNLVVCAYSLLESESYEERMATIGSLWQKTDEYLVIVENGTFAGHQAVMQARDHILTSGQKIDVKKAKSEIIENYELNDDEVNDLLQMIKSSSGSPPDAIQLPDEMGTVKLTTILPEGHVFAPCPHDLVCPRLLYPSQPCNFLARYESPTFKMKKPDHFSSEFFSFVIMKKGARVVEEMTEVKSSWPRLVGHPLVRGDQVWCRLCTSSGNLEEIPVSRGRHGSVMFRCAKDRNWGDLLPVQRKVNTEV